MKQNHLEKGGMGELLNKLRSNLPFKIRWVVIIFLAGFSARISVFLGGVLLLGSVVSFFGGDIVWGGKNDQDKLSGEPRCSKEKVIVESFNEDEECVSWKNNFGLDALVFLDDEHNIARPKLTENFSVGRELFLERKFGSDNRVFLEFTPQNEEKVNVSVNYGFQWRVIVGNGDYNKITLQYNSKYPKENLSTKDWIVVPEMNGKNWIFPNKGLEPQREISTLISSRAEEGTNTIRVNVVVTGFLKEESMSRDFEFNYKVPITKKSSDSFEQVGFGLLDPHQENIVTRLYRFEVTDLGRHEKK
jgi:hypothetical protein